MQFAYDQINWNLPKPFETFLTLKAEQYQHNTRKNSLDTAPGKTTIYAWLETGTILKIKIDPEMTLPDLSSDKFLKTMKKFIS